MISQTTDMIAVHFPEGIWRRSQAITMSIIYRPCNDQTQTGTSFVLHVTPASASNQNTDTALFHQQQLPNNKPTFNFSAMKLFNRFRKILMRLIFTSPSHHHHHHHGSASSSSKPHKAYCDNKLYEPPKTSCSSYYSSQSHYSEAIADCIEFFNKSSQDGVVLDGRKSDVWV